MVVAKTNTSKALGEKRAGNTCSSIKLQKGGYRMFVMKNSLGSL
jgi:hypothetical protein